MLTGTFVTVAGFVPIGFAQSAAGEYTFSIFAVVTIALIVSWFVAVLFAPLLGVVLLRKPKEDAATAKPDVVLRIFRGFLVARDAGAMDHHRGDAGQLRRGLPRLALRAAAVLPGLRPARARRRPHPAAERLDLRQRRPSPPGSTTLLQGDPDVERWSTYVGRGAIRFYLPLDVKLPNDFFSQAVIVAKDVAARERLQAKLEKALAEQMPERRRSRVAARARAAGRMAGAVPGERSGPGPGAGDRAPAGRGRGRPIPHIDEVNFDWMEPARQVRVTIDQDQARLLGLSSRTIAEVLNTADGRQRRSPRCATTSTSSTSSRGRPDEQRSSLSTLRALQLPLPNGRTVPLSQVATLRLQAGISADLAARSAFRP